MERANILINIGWILPKSGERDKFTDFRYLANPKSDEIIKHLFLDT